MVIFHFEPENTEVIQATDMWQTTLHEEDLYKY
jgi:hypothetical protein